MYLIIVSVPNKEDFLIVRSGTNQFIFRFSEIHYVASLKTKKRQVIVKTTNQEIVCDEKIITLKKELKPNNFYKDMKSFIINFDFVSSYNSLEGTITFRDQTELPFSKKVISKFGKAIIDYRSGGV
ncbi:LytTR family transcriptional regulator DNA-binding domain-containing protein [Enterococcus sp. UD-01]|uniref:LytTR family transcriptional regulator DNA-binding domain-containing protein n=1 Tax=Enterococcus sp. UD-01 TaxID=3373911 RepID=UPI003837881E